MVGVLTGMMKRSARARSVVARAEWMMPVNRPIITSTSTPEKARAMIAAM